MASRGKTIVGLILLAQAGCASSPPGPRSRPWEGPVEPVRVSDAVAQPSPVIDTDAAGVAAPAPQVPRDKGDVEVRLAVGETIVLRVPHTDSVSSQPSDAPCVLRPGPDIDSFLVAGKRAGDMVLLFVLTDRSAVRYHFIVAP